MNIATIKNKNNNVIKYEPYATFLSKYNKLGNRILNKKIKWNITSKNSISDCGFPLQYCYCENFDIEFKYYSILFDEAKSQREKFLIVHTLSYEFDDVGGFTDIMMEVIADLNKKNRSFYISNYVEECNVSANFDGINKVNIVFTVFCDRKDAKEVSLELLSHDVAVFARTF